MACCSLASNGSRKLSDVRRRVRRVSAKRLYLQLLQADVFIRDHKGCPVLKVVGKDDGMPVFLRQCEYHPVSVLPCLIPLQLQTAMDVEEEDHLAMRLGDAEAAEAPGRVGTA